MDNPEDIRIYCNQSKSSSPNFDDVVSIRDEIESGEDSKSHHVQLKGLGDIMGSDLFIGSGGTQYTCGPAPLLIGYHLLPFVIFNIMNQLALMTTYLPRQGSIA